MDIKIRFTQNEYEIERHGSWYDLKAAKEYYYKAGDFFLVDLGVNIKVPDGFEGHLLPRSSTFKNFGLIQTNSMGIIESEYCGNNDIWKMPVYALKDGHISIGDRLCQFTVTPKVENINFNVVSDMEEKDRGGFGSTGVK